MLNGSASKEVANPVGVMSTSGTLVYPDSRGKINYARFERRTAEPVQGYSTVHAHADPEKIYLSAPTEVPEYWADSIQRSRTQPPSFTYIEPNRATNLSRTYTRHADGVRYEGDTDDHILRTETVTVTFKPTSSADPRFVDLMRREADDRQNQQFLESRGMHSIYVGLRPPKPSMQVNPSMSLNA